MDEQRNSWAYLHCILIRRVMATQFAQSIPRGCDVHHTQILWTGFQHNAGNLANRLGSQDLLAKLALLWGALRLDRIVPHHDTTLVIATASMMHIREIIPTNTVDLQRLNLISVIHHSRGVDGHVGVSCYQIVHHLVKGCETLRNVQVVCEPCNVFTY